jgi:uncharacterized protein
MGVSIWSRRAGRQSLPLAVGAVLASLLIWLGVALAQGQSPNFPALSGRVVDAANIIPAAARETITQKLAAHETRTTDQIVVATVPTLEGLTVEDYANRLYRHWQLGTKDRNNGALLLVAPTERKVRIEVGYGLEGALTDALSKTIIVSAIAPKFRTGDFAGGIDAGVDGILSIASRDAEEWQRRPEIRPVNDGIPEEFLVLIVFVVILLFFVLPAVTAARNGRNHRTRSGRWIMLPPATGGWSGGGSNWGGGGGWSGGGGGFSGGGGSSGGGGASGDW